MIYAALGQLLREVFVDVQERNVAFSLGDLFGTMLLVQVSRRFHCLTLPDPHTEDSHFRLQDVFLKTEVIVIHECHWHVPVASRLLACG